MNNSHQPDLLSALHDIANIWAPHDFDVSGWMHDTPNIPWDAHGELAVGGAHAASQHPDSWTQQTTPFTCAVVSQKMILDDFGVTDPRTGAPLSEAQLVYSATSHGWLTDGGTSISDMGNLLDLYGVSSHHGAGMPDALSELAHGHKVIAAVNAEDLQDNHHWVATGIREMLGAAPDHAIVLEGVKKDAQGNLQVVVNDPGQSDGAGHAYPVKAFADAFGGAELHYVATDAAPPDLADHPVYGAGFDSAAGHYAGWDWLHSVEDAFTNTLKYADDHSEELLNVLNIATSAMSLLGGPARQNMMRHI